MQKPSKNVFIALTLILSLVTILGLTFLLWPKKTEPKQAETTVSKFTLIKESGDVQFKKNGTYEKMQADEIELENKTFVKTTEGLAHVFLPDNSMISLDNNTEVQILVSSNNTEIMQLAGSTWHRVKKLTSSDNYQVETPTALATVRGTKFAVETTNKNSEIYVTQSVVEVGQLDTSTGEKVWKNRKNLTLNKLASVQDIKTRNGFELNDIPESKKQLRWFQRNQSIDKDFDNEKSTDKKTFIQNLNRSVEKVALINDQLVKNNDPLKQDIPLGNSGPNPEFQSAIEASIARYTRIQGSGEETCNNLKDVDVDQVIAQFSAIESQYGVNQVAGNQFKSLLIAIKSACSDGKITPEESRNITSQAPKPN